jgi:hypothetical protein
LKDQLIDLLDDFATHLSRVEPGFVFSHFVDYELRRSVITGGGFVDLLLIDCLPFGYALALPVFVYDHLLVKRSLKDGGGIFSALGPAPGVARLPWSEA